MTTEIMTYKAGAPRKIKRQLGNWYLFQQNVKYQRWFAGLPDEKESLIILDSKTILEKAENDHDGYEQVWECFAAPEFELRVTEGGKVEKVPPIVKVGDIVILKGMAQKIHTKPIVYAAGRDNIVCVLLDAEDREDFVHESNTK